MGLVSFYKYKNYCPERLPNLFKVIKLVSHNTQFGLRTVWFLNP